MNREYEPVKGGIFQPNKRKGWLYRDSWSGWRGQVREHRRRERQIAAGRIKGPQCEYITLWHEILHGLLTQGGRSLDSEEEVVEVLAYGIVGVLRDNPWLTNVCWKEEANDGETG